MGSGTWRHNPEKFNPDLLPQDQGFDYSFLTPGSNDARVHLIRNKALVELNADMSTLTKRYTDEALGFIEEKHGEAIFPIPRPTPCRIQSWLFQLISKENLREVFTVML